MNNQEDGRVPDGTGLSQAEPQEGLAPSGFDPSRYEGKPRHIARAHRDILNSFAEPLFERIASMERADLAAFIDACRSVSPINCAWFHYEVAKMLHDAAVSTLEASDSDGSGEAGETALAGSTEGDSAGPKDIAQGLAS